MDVWEGDEQPEEQPPAKRPYEDRYCPYCEFVIPLSAWFCVKCEKRVRYGQGSN